MPSKVIHVISGDVWGGAEVQMGAQLPSLTGLGLEVHILLFNAGVTAEQYRKSGLNCHIAEESGSPLTHFKRCKEIAERIDPQIVCTHGYKEALVGAWLARSLKIPLVTTHHGAQENYRGIKQLKKRLYDSLHRRISLRAACCISVSKHLASELSLESAKRMEIVRNVMPSPDFKALSDDSTTNDQVVCVGRLVPVKRYDLAIEAFAEVKKRLPTRDLKLLILGEGPERERLQVLASSLEIADSVSFPGFVENAQQYIAQGAVLLISSKSEGIPTVLLERLWTGRPLVSVALPGIVEVINSIDGEYPYELVDPEKESQLSEALFSAVCESTNFATAQALHSIKEQYAPIRAAKQLAEIYASLV